MTAAQPTPRERPIIFTHNIDKLMDGRKTQSRRVVKLKPTDGRCSANCAGPEPEKAWADPGLGAGGYIKVPCKDGASQRVRCPYGDVGDRLWVRETCAFESQFDSDQQPPFSDGRPVQRFDDAGWVQPHYRATDPAPDLECQHASCDGGNPCQRPWRSPMFMPRWAARLTLEIVEVRAQRLQNISEEDAKAEGVDTAPLPESAWYCSIHQSMDCGCVIPTAHFIDGFRLLWGSINGNRPGCAWADSPWVWALTFRRVTP